uniref:Uncharacterized protein n=1 Tax=Arundo donax TaxID=35708 RepID=A0A0A8ZSE5_ARUDO
MYIYGVCCNSLGYICNLVH